MTVHTPGAQFKRFYQDPQFWPADNGVTYHDDVLLHVNGEPLPDDMDPGKVADDAKVSIVYGGVVYGAGKEVGLDEYFLRWLELQTTVSFLVECDSTKFEAVKAAIEAAGGTVA